MNRTIKFRGKRLDNGEWVYGSLLQGENQCVIATVKGDSINVHECFEVDPTTVGQFIGLLDKNGKEIYEGDIFTVNGKYPKLIEYRQEYAGFCMANTYDLEERPYIEPWQQIRPDWWNDYKREIMLIGNIHDNPELLNEK